MDIRDIMTKKIEYIDAEASVYDAIEKMVDKRIRSLLVRSKEEAGGMGVITVRDIAFRVIGTGGDPQKITVAEITSKPLICVQPDATLDLVLGLMQQSNVSRVFVCNEQKPCGVISIMDVVGGALIERARQGHGS
ncbi:MAG: hypothetical protein A2521_07485 [Deltaproteobacteria bacterium RIFOXYD12_FULL_57_12]|nr:MAG: hypothetical protein A2521_07485 [Deltaproteobacteria bacterium RIFOXYD12_FULL_57_12]